MMKSSDFVPESKTKLTTSESTACEKIVEPVAIVDSLSPPW
jgi:hypothetical protein